MFVARCARLAAIFHGLVLILGTSVATAKTKSLTELDYRVFPRRTEEEAAVLEWGHSAIISALDGSVAMFGPQTSQAALLEVEAAPILASPVNGISKEDQKALEAGEPLKLSPLDNEEEVVGNLVVMTNSGGLTGVQMAQIAQKSGAAALLVVNVEDKRPDDIYRLPATEGADKIDIPVVMISTNSANVLTSATVEPNMKRSQIVNHGMPDRVRLYAGGDRPFFEDVEAAKPTIYLIHNLLTEEECDSLVRQTSNKLSPITKVDTLHYTHDVDKFHNVERVMLWKGMVQGPTGKAIDERIEQVTGFPAAHYSNFVVDKMSKGSHVNPKFDVFPDGVPAASMTVFLTEAEEGGEIVFPSTNSDPIKILPQKGMAVVHHNTNDRNEFEMGSVHAILPYSGSGDFFVAHRYIFVAPLSHARRIALPVFAFPFGGKLPTIFSTVLEGMNDKFGENGGAYFDKFCVFVPLLIILSIAQYIGEKVKQQVSGKAPTKKDKKA